MFVGVLEPVLGLSWSQEWAREMCPASSNNNTMDLTTTFRTKKEGNRSLLRSPQRGVCQLSGDNGDAEAPWPVFDGGMMLRNAST